MDQNRYLQEPQNLQHHGKSLPDLYKANLTSYGSNHGPQSSPYWLPPPNTAGRPSIAPATSVMAFYNTLLPPNAAANFGEDDQGDTMKDLGLRCSPPVPPAPLVYPTPTTGTAIPYKVLNQQGSHYQVSSTEVPTSAAAPPTILGNVSKTVSNLPPLSTSGPQVDNNQIFTVLQNVQELIGRQQETSELLETVKAGRARRLQPARDNKTAQAVQSLTNRVNILEAMLIQERKTNQENLQKLAMDVSILAGYIKQ